MKRNLTTLILTGMLVVTMGAGTAQAKKNSFRGEVGSAKPNLVPVPKRPVTPGQIDIWTNFRDGAVLRPGQTVDVFFETRRDAYVVVVNIDTRGNARLLFPSRRYDDGFVRGREVVAIPGPGARYRLQVTGPRGVERILAFSSNQPLVDHWESLVDGGVLHSGAHYRSESTLSMSAAIRASIGNTTLELAGRKHLEPQLVETPVERVSRLCGTRIFSDETWFEVGKRRWRGRW